MKHTILLVEDYQPLTRAVEEKMKAKETACVTARSMDEALQALALHTDIELIWIDHHLLGDGTGLALLRQIRQDSRWKELPAIVVSNETSLEKIEEYKSLGVQKYYSKVETTLEEIGNFVFDLLEEVKT